MAVLGYSTGDILRYVAMPQVVPRMRALFRSGFAYLAYFMAQVFRAGNLINAEHPYLAASSIGTYGLMDVLVLASSRLVYDKKHIDQIAFFFLILTGLVLLVIQFFLLLLSAFVGRAEAAAEIPKSYSDFLTLPGGAEKEDLAYRLMDRVFGIPDLFNSKDAPAGGGFHEALHGLLQFYSLGLLVVAVLILAYFIAAIVAETAETGTPFGKRYNHVWAPVRLVVALGLLIPMGYGLNAAQWITLYSAKFGSNFATNGWNKFNDVLGESYERLDEADKLIHTPERPDISRLVAFMYMVKTCQLATQDVHKGVIVDAYLVKNTAESRGEKLSGKSYKAAREFFNKVDNIYIRFGELNQDNHTDKRGFVFPYCGSIMLPTANTHQPGATSLNEHYYDLIKELWSGAHKLEYYAQNEAFCESPDPRYRDACLPDHPPQEFYQDILDAVNKDLDKAIKESIEKQKEAALEENKEALDESKDYGWAGAGIYYNTIAEMNGAIASSLYNAPYPYELPFVMQFAKDEGRQEDIGQSGDQPEVAGRPVKYVYLGDENVFRSIQRAKSYWDGRLSQANTENIIVDVINLILGTDSLFNMCKNAEVHPLAQLAGVGRSLLESATRNLGLALLSSVGGMALAAGSYTGIIGAGASAAASFFVTFAMIGLMLGFLMYYVIPFMPFLYFFFAVTGWIKGIFEAMVGVPLWALAHLRIDGQGLPGDAAVGGYLLILEIFLRPILIIFGLLAAISIFAAMVRVLNEIFYLVVSNLGGFSKEGLDLCGVEGQGEPPVGSADYFRGPIDQFFFTVVYAVVVYLIGTSTFKMIDAVPNKILRWMGNQVHTFGDTQKDAGEGLLNKLSVGGYAITGQLQSAFGQAGGFIQGGMGLAGKMASSGKGGGTGGGGSGGSTSSPIVNEP